MIVQFGWTVLLLNLQRLCIKTDPEYPGEMIGRGGILVTLLIQIIGIILSFFLPYVALMMGSLIIVIYVFRPNRGEWRDKFVDSK